MTSDVTVAVANGSRGQLAMPNRMGASAVTAGATLGRSSSKEIEGPNRKAGRRSLAGCPAGTPRSEPAFRRRAHPGDVIGVETGGERTYVGDTAEDENTRRRDAVEADAKLRRDQPK